jgi:hypothetical protein
VKRRRIVAAAVGEVIEIIVVNPSSLGHGRAGWPVNPEHLPFRLFILKRIVVNLVIIAGNHHVGCLAGDFQFENVSRHAAMVGARGQFQRSRFVREFEAAQDNVGRGSAESETGCSCDFDAANSFRRDFDRMMPGSNGGDCNRFPHFIRAIGNNNLRQF